MREEYSHMEATSGTPFTTVGVKLFHQSCHTDGLQVSSVLSQSKDKVKLEIALFTRGQIDRHTVVITCDSVTCNCIVADQMMSLCVHGRCGVAYCVANNLLFYGKSELADALLRRCFPTCFQQTEISAFPTLWIPKTEKQAQNPIPVSDLVNVPPRYKQLKSRSTKRMRSTGEEGTANVQASPRQRRLYLDVLITVSLINPHWLLHSGTLVPTWTQCRLL
jgi:hypothetical protein